MKVTKAKGPNTICLADVARDQRRPLKQLRVFVLSKRC
jgi:hypothetical protein